MNPNTQPPPADPYYTSRDESTANASTKAIKSVASRENIKPVHPLSKDTGIISSLKSAFSRLTRNEVLLTAAQIQSGFPNAIIHDRISIASDIEKQWLMLHYTKSLVMMEVIPQVYRFSMELPQSLRENADVVHIPDTMYMLLCLRVKHTTLQKNKVARDLRGYETQMPATLGTKLTMIASVRQGDPSKRNISIVATLPSHSSLKPKQLEELQGPQEGTSAWKSLGNHLGKNKTGKGNKEQIRNNTSLGLQLTEVNNRDAFEPTFTHTFGFQSCSDLKPMDGRQSIEQNEWDIAVLFRLDKDDHPIVDVNFCSELYSAPYADRLSKSFELTVKEVQRKLQLDQRTGEDEYNDRQECVLECVGSSGGSTDVYNDDIGDDFYVSHWENSLVAI